MLFGSINAAVELKCRLGVNSTFNEKQNKNYCLISSIKSVLLWRYPTQPAGHLVVMKAKNSWVVLFLIVYAWSKKGKACTVSTWAINLHKIEHHSNYNQSKFPDGYGKIGLPPFLVHLLHICWMSLTTH